MPRKTRQPKQLEHPIQNEIRQEISKYLYPLCGFCPCWRINVGQGWIGDSEKFYQKKEVTVYPGDVIVRQARVFDTGATPGFSDLIGAVPVVITPGMIGKKIAVFSAVEVKSNTGKSRPEQENFIQQMQSLGARAGIARSPEDAIRILRGER